MQIDRRLVLHQVRVHRVAAGVDAARDEHHVADLQRADCSSEIGALQGDLAPGAREAGGDSLGRQHRLRRRDSSRYIHDVIAPVPASRCTPSRRKAQQS